LLYENIFKGSKSKLAGFLEDENMGEIKDSIDGLMSNEEKSKIDRPSMDIAYLNRLFHPFKKNQDGRCEYIEWMGEDLLYLPGIGEWKCKQSGGYGPADQYGSRNFDYNECNCKDFNVCEKYLKATNNAK
jgi:hypothetical protein